MMKRVFISGFAIILFLCFNSVAQNIESPSQFLGYPIGTAFSYHHKVVDYFQYVAGKSENVQLVEYGQTYERRELNVAYISSSENLNKLEEIKNNNLKRTGLLKDKPALNDIAIVWLSYNVHGNEANSTETAMKVLYEIAQNENGKYSKWLEKMVIILDPCINPDGRDRYANWYNQVSNKTPNPNINSREHHEGWTHGRSNHYLFDLNRDWVWQTQIESQQRLKLYNEWFPHVHVDFHEQYFNSQYYFAPAAKPMHELITDWQKEFQVIIGKNNAKYFDENGWLYFTRESFDLLYPGYGDTYPTFNGAIGMTYEMPGHSRAGLAIKTKKGDTLTLNDRMNMHFTTSMATLEACYESRQRLIDEFSEFFRTKHDADVYYILKSNRKDRLDLLTELLDKNKIIYKSPTQEKSIKSFSFNDNNEKNIRVNINDLIVPLDQPKSTLVKVLFERNTKLTDTLTYDITAWALPYVYGLDAYQAKGDIKLSEYSTGEDSKNINETNPYAYLLNWTSVKDARFLSDLLSKKYRVNYSTKSFSYNGMKYSAGSLLINQVDNVKQVKDFHTEIMKMAKSHNRNLVSLQSGSSIPTMDLGSHKISFMTRPKIAILAGDGISTLNFGELWYFFEQELDYPIDVIENRLIDNIDLDEYSTIILASGKYAKLQSETGFNKVDDWVKKGGDLVLIENAIDGFIGENKFSLKKSTEDKKDDEKPEPILYPYEDSERENLKKYIQGGIIKLKVDNSHPLAYGYDDYYYTLKNNNVSYGFLSGGWNVGYITNTKETVAGFVGSTTKPRLDKNVVIGVEERGQGKVIYFVDNPLFRAFWQNGKLLLANAVFFN